MERTLILQCPLNHDDGVAGHRCYHYTSGKRAYVSQVEHIRKMHKEHHIPGLKSTAENWQRMIGSTPRRPPPPPPQVPREPVAPVASAVGRAPRVMQRDFEVAPLPVNHQAAPQVSRASGMDSNFSENPFESAFGLAIAAPPQRALPADWWDFKMSDLDGRFPESAFNAGFGFAAPALPPHDVQAAPQDSPMQQDFIMAESHQTFDGFVLSTPGDEVQAAPQSFQEHPVTAVDVGEWHPEGFTRAEWYTLPETTIIEQTSPAGQPNLVAPQQFDYQVDPEEPPEHTVDWLSLETGDARDGEQDVFAEYLDSL
ncbi:hypothetical protein Slin15195_G062770 [Septoria linicola]|uniref:Uncharacterized protein n=1 Tax=Septoria linicola TaxID=215465 RepID=A0A9Q9ATL9_9PEZI|nr:hypothetical protein Slin15195_G062770 [Septoria linicola]